MNEDLTIPFSSDLQITSKLNPAMLVINTEKSFGVKKIYAKKQTRGLVKDYSILNIEVCGTEKLSAPANFKLFYNFS